MKKGYLNFEQGWVGREGKPHFSSNILTSKFGDLVRVSLFGLMTDQISKPTHRYFEELFTDIRTNFNQSKVTQSCCEHFGADKRKGEYSAETKQMVVIHLLLTMKYDNEYRYDFC